MASAEERLTSFRLLRLRNFLLLTLSGTMSQFGDRLTHMLLITVIGQESPGRLFAYSQGALIFTLPTLLLSPFVGVLVDHWDKRLVLARVHFLQTGILLLAIPVMTITRSFLPFWLALFLFFGLDVFNNAASPALLPMLVPRNTILSANSVHLSFARLATVLGMVLGGFLVRWTGWNYGLALDASCHLAAGLLILGIVRPPLQTTSPPIPSVSLTQSSIRLLTELLEVVRTVTTNGLVAFVFVSLILSTFVSAVSYTVLIYLVQQELGLGTGGVGTFAGVVAIGMIGGAAIMSILPASLDRSLVVIGTIILYALLFLAGPFFLAVWYIVIVSLVSGIAFSWLSIAQTTILQEQVPAQIRGRIFSTRELLTNIVFILATIAIGTLGDLTSIKTVLVIIGVILLGSGVAGLFWASRLQKKKR